MYESYYKLYNERVHFDEKTGRSVMLLHLPAPPILVRVRSFYPWYKKMEVSHS